MALSGTLLPLAAARGYSGSSADTSDSGGDMSISGRSYGAGQSVRSVVLCRRHGPVHLTNFGFALRGGKEFGTGCFVTSVERNSEAHSQGLVVGDQIIRINGYPIEDATHREVLSLIQNQMNIHLKVRSVGMVPNKDSFDDTVIWRIIEPDPGITLPVEDHTNPATHSLDVRLVINVPPRAKLGCGICKGPDWKPGIFIQFTKENSLARTAGLRQGDQIMQCNNVVFTPFMEFTEATSVLRNSGVLDLIVRKGSGLDLFPGESSGYNSSASSVAGDQSPETWPNKRLSIVKEESIIDSERLSHCDSSYRNGNERRTEGVPSVSEENCTVIHVGPSLNKTYETRMVSSNNNNKLAEICMVSKQLETTTTTVLVEVHQTEEETNNNSSDPGSCQLSSGANSLCSAISQELQRRSERRVSDKNAFQPQLELFKTGMDKDKVEQHQQLMEEFKRAHRKMFSNEVISNRSEDSTNGSAKYLQERESHLSKQLALQEQNKIQAKQLQCVDVDSTRHVRRQTGAAPPPPPLPKEDQSPPPAPPFPPPSPPYCPTPDYDTQSFTSERSIEAKANKSAPRVKNASSDFVEMQSIESFKLTNPSVAKPKPPPTYFKNKSSDSSSISSRETTKPAVTIREYPSNQERKIPEKLSFLHQAVDTLPKDEPLASRLQNELTQTLSRANLKANQEVTSNGTNKNVVTISINASQQPSATDPSIKHNPFFLFLNEEANDRLRSDVTNNNTKMVSSTPLNITELHGINLKRSSIHFPIDKGSDRTVTFNFGKSEKLDSRIVSVVQPNGILKNGPVGNVSQIHINSGLLCNKPPQKNIKFGDITTIAQTSSEPKM